MAPLIFPISVKGNCILRVAQGKTQITSPTPQIRIWPICSSSETHLAAEHILLPWPKPSSALDQVSQLLSYPLSPNQGSENFLLKVQIVNISGFVGQMGSVATTQLGCCSSKAILKDKQTNGCGSAAIEVGLKWTPKLEFQIIFMQQNIIIHPIFFQPFRNVKSNFSLLVAQRHAAG